MSDASTSKCAIGRVIWWRRCLKSRTRVKWQGAKGKTLHLLRERSILFMQRNLKIKRPRRLMMQHILYRFRIIRNEECSCVRVPQCRGALPVRIVGAWRGCGAGGDASRQPERNHLVRQRG